VINPLNHTYVTNDKDRTQHHSLYLELNVTTSNAIDNETIESLVDAIVDLVNAVVELRAVAGPSRMDVEVKCDVSHSDATSIRIYETPSV
jgi:hypothetical protein